MSKNIDNLYKYNSNVLKPKIELINQNINSNLQTISITGSLSNLINVSLNPNKILINNDNITTSDINIASLNYLSGLSESITSTIINTSNVINNTSNNLINFINDTNTTLTTKYNIIDTNSSNYNSNIDIDIINRLTDLNISNILNGSINKYIENNLLNTDLTVNGNVNVLNGFISSNIVISSSKTVANEDLQIVSSSTNPALTIQQNNNQNTVEIYGNTGTKFIINNSGNIGIGKNPTTSNSLEIIGDINSTGLYSNSLPFSYSGLSNIPLEFTPSAHLHNISDISGLTIALDAKQSNISALTSNNNTITINSGLNLSSGYTFKEDNIELTLQSSIITTTTSETTNYWNEKTSYDPTIIENGILKQLLSVPNSSDKYYAFTSTSGINSITFLQDTICDVLIVGGGGGGGGGSALSSGGGAGGLIYATNVIIPANTYYIIIGNGGNGGVYTTSTAQNGQDTTAFGAIAFGGGAGQTNTLTASNPPTGINGGSGGGGAQLATTVSTLGGAGGIATKGNLGTLLLSGTTYGESGGMSYSWQSGVGSGGSGGGGGAITSGRNGNNSSSGAGGDGGDGFPCDITGVKYYFAGGGGGSSISGTSGSGGIGGGGGGGTGGGTLGTGGGSAYLNTSGSTGSRIISGSTYKGGNAAPNSGGGGGASSSTGLNSVNIGGNGGSGIVIIRIKQQSYPSNISYASTSIDANSLVLRNYSSNIIANGTLSQPISYDVVNSAFVYEFYPGSNYVNFPYDTTCDLLLIGGGGSGGTSLGTGGNSGNVIYSTDVIVPAGNYNIIVGEGGSYGQDGGDTTAFGATSKGGRGIIAKIPSGIKASVPPQPVIGNSSYVYYAFTTNGSITFSNDTICDILIVGGGGAGGNSMGGGGGAGGVVYTVNQTITTGTYSIGVGTGGIGLQLLTDGQGAVGENQNGKDSFIKTADGSSFIQLNMGGVNQNLRGIGGGAGGVYYNSAVASVNGISGGSGGGSTDGNDNTIYTGGSSTQPNTLWNGSIYIQGGSSGNTNATANYQGGGGGGAGGQIFNNTILNGKTGVIIPITGVNQYYAAGGGGGQYNTVASGVDINKGFGANSIGGNGRIWNGTIYIRNASSGLNGTGSGGGGGAYAQDPDEYAGNGGSGIVIIRVPTDDIIYEENGSIYRLNDNNIIENNAVILNKFDTVRENLIAWYKFDGDFSDSSGNGKHLTGGTGTSFDDDRVVGTKSISFPKSVNQSLISNIDLSGNKSFTISLWSYRNSDMIAEFMISAGDSKSNHRLLSIGYTGDNKIYFGFWTETLYTEPLQDQNTWVHFTMIYDSDNKIKHLYKNGMFLKSTAQPTATNIPATENNFIIGTQLDGSPFNGKLDDVRIYNRALTPDEIEYIYSTTNTKADFLPYATSPAILYNNLRLWYKFSGKLGTNDSSIYSLNAKAIGTPVISNKIIKITKDNYLQLPSNVIDFNNDITICFWYRFDNGLSNGRVFDLGTIQNKTSHANSITMCRNGTLGLFYFIVDTLLVSIELGHTTSGQMIHLSWVIKKNGIWNIYKNGILLDTRQGVYPKTNTYTYSYLGKSTWTGEFAYDNQVSLKDFRIYNRSLTEDEIYNIYNQTTTTSLVAYSPAPFISNNNFYNNTTNMLVWYKFDGNLTDSSGNGLVSTLTNTISYGLDYANNTNGALAFNGSGYFSTVSGTTNYFFQNYFTVSFWIYTTNIVNTIEALVASRNGGVSAWNIYIKNRQFNLPIMTSSGVWGGINFNTFVETNSWKYCTFLFNMPTTSTLTVSLYINSEFKETLPLTGGSAIAVANVQNLTIGSVNGTFTCQNTTKMDDFRIYNRILSQDEINVLYNNDYKNTTYLRKGYNLAKFYNDTTDMYAWYKFDGDLTDSSGNNYHSVLKSGTIAFDNNNVIQGSGSLKFNGSTVYSSTPSVDKDPFNSNTITVSVWHYSTTSINDFQSILSTRPSSGLYGFTIYILPSANNNTLSIQYGTSTTWDGIGTSFQITPNSTWRHICFTVDENKFMTLYVNGTLIGSKLLSNFVVNTAKILYFGANVGGTSYKLTNNTLIDDVRIYNRALSPSEIDILYNQFTIDEKYNFYNDTKNMYLWYKFNGDLTDSSGNGNNATGFNTPTFNTIFKIEGTHSISFAGGVGSSTTSQYLTVPPTNFSQWDGFTVSLWLNFDSVATWSRVFDFGNTGINNNNMMLYRNNNTTGLNVRIFSGATFIYNNVIQLNTWFHVAISITKSPPTINMYINGTLRPQSSLTGSVSWLPNVLYDNFYIAKSNFTDDYFSGQIDDFRIYNRALSPSEINILYKQYSFESSLQTFYNETIDILAWYKFDGNTNDSSGNGNNLTNTNCIFNNSSIITNSQCVEFTGTSYLRQSNTIYCPSQTSICFWGYFTGNGWSQIISTQSGTSGWLIQISNTNTIKIFISNNQPDVFTFGATGYPSYNEWFHFVLVLNSVSNIHYVYVNGVLVQTYSYTYTPVAQSLSIGTQLGTPGFSLKNGEKLEDVRIYNRALTPSEIALLANRFGGAGGSVMSPGTFTTSGGIGGDALIIPMRYNESFAKGGDGFTYNTLSTSQGIGYGGIGSTSLTYNPGGRGTVIIRIPYQPYIVDADKFNQQPTQIPGTNDFYYAFTSTTGTNSITFRENTLCDVLIVGGGGSGGYYYGGGGGGGAVVYAKNVTIPGSATPYEVVVGNYGIYNKADGSGGRGGDSSVFGAIAKGGAPGAVQVWGDNTPISGLDGGCGSGGRLQPGGSGLSPNPGGQTTITEENYGNILSASTSKYIYGNDGGIGIVRTALENYTGTSGGGGGAGEKGYDGYNSDTRSSVPFVGGNGGDGIGINITGTTSYYGAGGGGAGYDIKAGNGGMGGGGGGSSGGPGGVNGNGGYSDPSDTIKLGTDATNYQAGHGANNTGSGGGGAYWTSLTVGGTESEPGDGGSGIVIIRWTIPGTYTTAETSKGGVYVDKGNISTVSGDITTYGGNVITNDCTVNNDIVINTLGYTDKKWKIYGNNDAQFDLSFDDSANNGINWTTSAKMRGNGGIKGFVNFTGMHHCKALTPELYDDKYIGYIVSSTKQYQSMNSIYDSSNIQRNIDKNAWDALPIVALASEKDKKVFGVIAKVEDNYSDSREEMSGNIVNYFEKKSHDRRLHIAGVGEGGIWVCNYNNTVIESGDYITTSPIAGIGMKQDDDLVHGYTVGKATMDCDFNPKKIPVKILTKIGDVYDKDSDGNYIYSDLLDDNGEVIYEDEYEIKYITLDGTIIDSSDASDVYKIAFIGCSYTCS